MTFVLAEVKRHINVNARVTTMLHEQESAKNKKQTNVGMTPKGEQRERKPERILMTQLSDSQI